MAAQLMAAQIEASDVVILSKTDLVGEESKTDQIVQHKWWWYFVFLLSFLLLIVCFFLLTLGWSAAAHRTQFSRLLPLAKWTVHFPTVDLAPFSAIWERA